MELFANKGGAGVWDPGEKCRNGRCAEVGLLRVEKRARSAMTNAFEVRVVRGVTRALVEGAWFGRLLGRR